VRTQRLFPSTQRRVQVVEQASVFRNPIEMAIESMEGKNAELETKIKVGTTCTREVIDSTVLGIIPINQPFQLLILPHLSSFHD
jgi:hypothetical protein